jgi:hypothetical protein
MLPAERYGDGFERQYSDRRVALMKKGPVATIVFATGTIYGLMSLHHHEGHVEINPVNGPIGQIQVVAVSTSSSTGMSTGTYTGMSTGP